MPRTGLTGYVVSGAWAAKAITSCQKLLQRFAGSLETSLSCTLQRGSPVTYSTHTKLNV